MSGSISSLTNPSVTAANSAASAAVNSAAASGLAGASSGTTSGTSNDAMASLSGNFNDFLKLLMTQLQNQDPTSPMDTSQFTTELVQFSGVEQQINTNNSLTSLIQLTQGSQMLQGASLVGKQVDLQSTTLPLQNGSAALQYTAASAQPVSITVANSAGSVVRNASVQASQGANDWSWDGTDNRGNQLPDGAYTVSVTGADANGSTGALPFTVLGTVTGIQKDGSSLDLQLGAMTAGFDKVQQVVGG